MGLHPKPRPALTPFELSLYKKITIAVSRRCAFQGGVLCDNSYWSPGGDLLKGNVIYNRTYILINLIGPMLIVFLSDLYTHI